MGIESRFDNVCIVIPAFNEAVTIGSIVSNLRTFFPHVIVVNDASHDTTSQEACRFGALVIDRSINGGYDKALNEGFARAEKLGMKYVITADGDGQHQLADIRKIAEVLVTEECDLAVGIRPTFARFSERLFSIYARLRFQIKDPLCGLKGYSLVYYKELGHFACYDSIGTELAFFSVKQKAKIREVPISTNRRLAGTPSFGNFIAANRKILRALWLTALRF